MGGKYLHGIITAFTAAVAALLTITAPAWAQSASTLDFRVSEWDFGRIKEADGPVSHTFEFTNTGDNAIVIERVSVSCGCTTPEYSKEPVLPGKKGKIKVTYDPAMRPGYFSKDIYVISNNGKNNDRIVIKGEVEGKPRTVEQDYPYLYENKIRINTLSANFRYVGQGATAVQTVGYTNIGPKPVKLSFEVADGDGIVTVENPGEVCPGCSGEAKIRVSVPRGDRYGKLAWKVHPVVDGVRQKLAISVSAIATEDFSAVPRGQEPSAKVTPSYHNFGKVRKGATVSYSFTLENTGNAPLIVRSVIPQDGIATDLKDGVSIAPGKSIKVKCTLDTTGAASGTYTKIITVILNDRARPMRELRLAATVE